ncbi:MAG: FeoB-associated Cys-rich membrane protein [Candidatus Lernaella stagnicola]|nr:FeoB-associated Cys-rich membrane protein [Candidatus Lernaella stagnicola]
MVHLVEYILVVLLVVGAAVYLIWHYAANRKKRAAGVCTGDCATCPYADHESQCVQPSLRNEYLDDPGSKE